MIAAEPKTTGQYQPYPEYKDSGVIWSGFIPSHWEPIRFKHVFVEKPKTSNIELPAGSISFGQVVFKDEEKLAEETKASYQEVKAGEFLVNPLNLNFDLKSLRTALSEIDVVVSTGYIVLQCYRKLEARYARWLLHEFDVAHMKSLGAGVRQTIGFNDIGNSYFCMPRVEEQLTIGAFLDHETARIDRLIAQQQRLIELLKEKRQAVISHAVTKGLNPNAPMKDSGVEWLGQVPEHWEVTRSKFVSEIFVPQRNKPELNDIGDGIFWATMEDMKNDEINETRRFVSSDAATISGSKVLQKGAVVASCVGNFGVAALLNVDVIINQQLQAYIPKTISGQYLRDLILISKTYFELVGTAATLIYVNQEGFGNMPVTRPPIEEQLEIEKYNNKIKEKFEHAIAKGELQVSLLQERRTALISAAVTGKIDLRGWTPPVEEVAA
ncbi:restriction endonuclease subunit S [Aeromonas sp. A04]|uniref:restriction endonuclease subunit S n=1 Tax=Aeromonas sp. A04 TaxID=3398359 RepID=UPI0039F65491